MTDTGPDAQQQESISRAARRLAAIVESSDDAIVSKDLEGIVTTWNGAAERMFGYTAAEMIGQPIRRIIPQGRQDEEDNVLATIRRGDKVDHFETLRQRKDGSLIPISLTVSPIRDDSGRVVGASKIARDISERKEADAERARLLALAQEHAAFTDQLAEVGKVVVSGLDRARIVQAVTDAGVALTHAQFGAFDPAFRESSAVRSDDITQDARYADNPPFHDRPAEHLPVRSYLAVPVQGRNGEVSGGLVFGHGEPGRFRPIHERLATGVAAWASVALENARLYQHAQEASRLKDEFLATLSHELRTPLNAVLGYARLVRSGLLPADHRERAIEVIERNATSLTQIVEDVLDVSRIISGKLRLNVQSVDVPDVVRAAIDAVAPAAEAKRIRIDAVLDPRAAPISGDPGRLQQIVWNLMSNAVKFTPKGGKVQVRLARVNSHIEIIVADTGIGMAAEFLPFVFDPFRQADAGTTREQGGLGLGLGIARQLVEMHGGTIAAFSEGVGHGATFRVMLPVMIVQPRIAPETEAAPVNNVSRGGNGQGRRQEPAPDLHGVRVLVVDDESDALAMVRDVLEAGGAEVRTAGSGAEALAVLIGGGGERPDVLLADLGMPKMDGFALIQRIRALKEPSLREIPAVALTAYARAQDRTRALRSGFQLHLSKPIDPAELLAAIESMTKRPRR